MTTGPYRLVRHPIYTGIPLAILGTLIGSAKVRELVVLAASVPAVCLKFSIEEKLMLRQFPQAYTEYKRRTKALVPFVL